MKALQWIGVGLGTIILLAIVLGTVLHLVGSRRLAQAPEVSVRMIDIPADEAAIARGKHLAHTVSGCADCHGQNLGGAIFFNEAPIGRIPAPNLTAGAGGIGLSYSDEEWLQAMRHGIGGDGRILGIMPSHWYTLMSDEDMGALIAYLRSAPPVDNQLPQRRVMFPGTIIFGLLDYGTLPFSLIDHNAVQPAGPPPEGVTVEYGAYFTTIALCGDCHGANLAGRIMEEGENGPPPGPNLTPGGELANWSEADFIKALRLGLTPEGHDHVLDPVQMPWPYYSNMTDAELKAMWVYLQSLPARELAQNQ